VGSGVVGVVSGGGVGVGGVGSGVVGVVSAGGVGVVGVVGVVGCGGGVGITTSCAAWTACTDAVEMMAAVAGGIDCVTICGGAVTVI
jgi:hypothetical protein